MKIGVAANMTSVRTHWRPANANVDYAIHKNSPDHIVIAMPNFGAVYKD